MDCQEGGQDSCNIEGHALDEVEGGWWEDERGGDRNLVENVDWTNHTSEYNWECEEDQMWRDFIKTLGLN